MSKLKGEKMLMKFEYDFALHGGAIGEIVLPQVAGNLPLGAKILNAYAVAETALASGGSAVVSFGISGSVTRYTADSFSALSGAEGVAQGADLLLAALATDVPVMDISVAALTAGKLSFYLEILA